MVDASRRTIRRDIMSMNESVGHRGRYRIAH